MKKKLWIPITILVCLIGIIGLFLLLPKNTIITLDINPSMQLTVNSKGIVKKVKAINEDAKEVISNDLTNKNLEEVLDILSERILEQGYIKNDQVIILFHVEGNNQSEKIMDSVREPYEKKNMSVEMIVIDKITNKDKQLAKKLGISPAKAAYARIKQKEMSKLSIEEIGKKPVYEVKEMQERGLYCEEDWTLEGDFCIKEIRREKATPGKVCPKDTYEYNGKCMEEVAAVDTDSLTCREEFVLEGKKCTRTITINAEPTKFTCPSGEAKKKSELGLAPSDSGEANDILCVDLSNVTHPVSPCELNDGTEHMTAGGTCYWHRAPVIDSGCPGKIQVGGECWDDASGILICAGARDGKQYASRDDICEGSIHYIEPVISEYKCPNGYEKQDTTCSKIEKEDPEKGKECPNGYEKVDHDRCINSNEKEKIDGYICTKENERVEKDMCILYERKEAKRY